MRSMLDANALPHLVAVLMVAVLPHAARAWVYPEHRQLALSGVQRLDNDRRAVFDGLWQAARAGDEQRLCAAGADYEQGTTPSCIDWAALSAIAGDHSCSSQEMFETARGAPWILQVADVAAQLKEDLARIPVTPRAELTGKAPEIVGEAQRRVSSEALRAQRINALRTRRHPTGARRPRICDACRFE